MRKMIENVIRTTEKKKVRQEKRKWIIRENSVCVIERENRIYGKQLLYDRTENKANERKKTQMSHEKQQQ